MLKDIFQLLGEETVTQLKVTQVPLVEDNVITLGEMWLLPLEDSKIVLLEILM